MSSNDTSRGDASNGDQEQHDGAEESVSELIVHA